MRPEDLLTFVHLNSFTREWRRLGLGDDDLRALEVSIMVNPRAAPVVAGTGGLRKARFAPRGWHVGKRGALRIGYAYFQEHGVVALIVAFAKKGQADLTPDQKPVVKQLIERMLEELLEHSG